MTDEPVLIERRGRVGLLTLNRPKPLSALNSALLVGRGPPIDSHAAAR